MTKGQAPVTLVVQQHLSVISAHSNCVQLDGSRYSKRSEVKASLSLLSLNHDLAPVSDVHPARWLALLLAALEVG